MSYDQAIELVRASSLYTVHTPVPAGHDYFDEGLFGKYMGGYPAKMGISWDDLMDLGRNNPGDKGERFCMSIFACNTSQEVNGVSWLHGKVSQEMFSSIWKGYFPEEMHVGYVTNGVHFPTWSATEGNISMLLTSTRTSCTISLTRRFGKLSIMCPMKKSGKHVWL